MTDDTPEAMLKVVLEREAATAARYDARIEALEAECDEALNQLDSERHSREVIEHRATQFRVERDALAEKLAMAVGALGRLVALDDDYSPFGGEMLQDRVERTWQEARATLAQITGGKTDG